MTNKKFINLKLITLITLFIFISNFCLSNDNIITNDQKKLIIDEQLQLAEGLAIRGYYKQAINEYKDIIKRFPNSALIQEAWAQLAYVQAKDGKNKEAINSYNIFLKNYPLSSIYTAVKINYARLLGSLKEKNKREEGINILKEIIDDETTSLHLKEAAAFYLAEIYHTTGKKQDAMDIYEDLGNRTLNKKQIYRAYALLKIANYYTAEKKQQKAIEIYNNIIDNDNLNDEVRIDGYQDLALLYTKNKQYELAADIYGRLAKQFPKTEQANQAVYHKLECLYFAKQYALTVSEIDKLLKSSFIHDKEKLYFIRACSLQQQTLYSAAFKSFMKVIEFKHNTDFYRQAAMQSINCLEKEDKVSEIITLTLKFINDQLLTLQNKKIIIETSAQTINTTQKRVIFWKEVVSSLSDKRIENWCEYKLALSYLDNHQVNEALTHLKNVLNGENKELHPYALNSIISCYLLLNDIKEANKYLDKVIEEYSKSSIFPNALLTKIEICINEQKFDEAYTILNKYNKTLMESENWPKAVYYLGCINYIKENWNEAQANFEKIMSNPNLSNSERSESKLYLALIHIEKRNNKEALKLLLPLIKDNDIINYCNQNIILKLGSFFLETKHYSEALLCFKKIVETTTDNLTEQNAYSGIAKSYLEQGNLADSIKYYKKAAFIKPATANTNIELANLANTLLKDNKPEEALIIFQKILETPSDNKSTIEARMGMARILSKDPDRILRANRYAMSVFILSKNPELCREAMLLSIKLSIKANNIDEAENTWNEYCTNFPKYTEDKKAIEIKNLLFKHLK